MPRSNCRLLTVAWVLLCASPSAAQYTCSEVTRLGYVDPDGDIISRSFSDTPFVNSAGDALVVARPFSIPEKIYLFAAGGPVSVLVAGEAATPTAGLNFQSRSFSRASINDAHEVAFLAEYEGDARGTGVFAIDAGGTTATVALEGDAAPSGALFANFKDLTAVSSSGKVAFLARLESGGDGIYLHDIRSGGPVTTVAETGEATAGGREVCRIRTVDFADSDQFAALAETKISCADPVEGSIPQILHLSGGVITAIASRNEPTTDPALGDSFYGRFKIAPRVNSSGEVLFETKLKGERNGQALFRGDGLANSFVIGKGDFSPEANGVYRQILDVAFASNSSVIVEAKFKGEGAKIGVVELDSVGGTQAVVLHSDAPPDSFSAGAAYTKFDATLSASHDGAEVVLSTRLLNTVAPTSQAAVVRCSR